MMPECPKCGQALKEMFDEWDEFMFFHCPSCGYCDVDVDEDEDE